MPGLTNLTYQPPEFQLQPLPDTNPILEGVRWKQYHAALGSTLEKLPEESWDIVKKEKSEDMIHVLDFPYNGEPPRVSRVSRSLLFASYLTRLGSLDQDPVDQQRRSFRPKPRWNSVG